MTIAELEPQPRLALEVTARPSAEAGCCAVQTLMQAVRKKCPSKNACPVTSLTALPSTIMAMNNETANNAPDHASQYIDRDFGGAQFIRCDMTKAVFRGVEIVDADIDGVVNGMRINGVDISAYLESELNKRFPGRELRNATTPHELQLAWAALRSAWDALVSRAQAMPPESVEISVAGEWSFSETIRHLVMATDAWLGKAILGDANAFHPYGMPFAEYEAMGFDTTLFRTDPLNFAEVLEVRIGHQSRVETFIASVEPEQLPELRPNPWDPQQHFTVLRCLQIIIKEEWDHLRFAQRDLDEIERQR